MCHVAGHLCGGGGCDAMGAISSRVPATARNTGLSARHDIARRNGQCMGVVLQRGVNMVLFSILEFSDQRSLLIMYVCIFIYCIY